MLSSLQINAFQSESNLWKEKLILFLNAGREALQRATSASNIEDNHCSGISGDDGDDGDGDGDDDGYQVMMMAIR